ncbi:YbaK/EbsC family protein [Acinetobacter gerneri]|uniref:YbaK/EbsC family protein n=1 Tax=Acinetobacter gerneri TaxID=202952 RepID=UPI003A8472E1
MTEASLDQSPFEQISSLLDSKHVQYQVIEHASEGKSEEVAKIRGTEVGQGAKALVCQIRGQSKYQYLLVISAGDSKVDFKKLAEAIQVKRVSMASVETAFELTACVPGSVPPFSFHDALTVIADHDIFNRFDEIAFNAGSLSKSIKMKSKDYLQIVQPILLDIIQEV